MRRASLALLVLTCTACQTMNPRARGPSPTTFDVRQQPTLSPFAEGDNLILIDPLVVRFGEGADSLVIPAGFVSDLASIPGVAQSLISKLGPHIRAAIVHDYLYWTQGLLAARSRYHLLEDDEGSRDLLAQTMGHVLRGDELWSQGMV